MSDLPEDDRQYGCLQGAASARNNAIVAKASIGTKDTDRLPRAGRVICYQHHRVHRGAFR